MPLDFQCPHCGHQTRVDDRYSGQSGPCAGCGRIVAIPPISGAAGSAPPASSGSGAIIAILLCVAAGFVLICGGVGFVTFSQLREASRRTRAISPNITIARQSAIASQPLCQGNLKALAVAMHNYHDFYQSFPPAYVADEDGTPMHSWRVLLLPYLGRQELYAQYDFDEPWDGPNNSRLISMMPSEYYCPDNGTGTVGETSYLMIVGPGMLSDGENSSSLADIMDGTSNSLMFVESHGSGIAWTEPRDLDGTTMSFRVNSGVTGELNGHSDGVNAALCDGSVRVIPNGASPQDIRNLATIADGQVVTLP